MVDSWLSGRVGFGLTAKSRWAGFRPKVWAGRKPYGRKVATHKAQKKPRAEAGLLGRFGVSGRSVIVRQENGGRAPVRFGNNPEFQAGAHVID